MFFVSFYRTKMNKKVDFFAQTNQIQKFICTSCVVLNYLLRNLALLANKLTHLSKSQPSWCSQTPSGSLNYTIAKIPKLFQITLVYCLYFLV